MGRLFLYNETVTEMRYSTSNIQDMPRITHCGTLHIRNSREFIIRKKARERGGFTVVEGLVMVSIVMIISLIVLVNFRGLGGNVALRRSVQELALDLRRAQGMALAVRRVSTTAGPVIPRVVGVHFTLTSPSGYFSFVDLNLNRIYDAGTDAIINESNVVLPGRASISGLNSYDGGGNPVAQSVVTITFAAPDAAMAIYNASGAIGDSARIELAAPAISLVKSVRVRTSGQVSIE